MHQPKLLRLTRLVLGGAFALRQPVVSSDCSLSYNGTAKTRRLRRAGGLKFCQCHCRVTQYMTAMLPR